MKIQLHTADSRGHANHGWLNSHHTFSFASYQNRERVHFGMLRVLNDDEVAPGRGFGTHPHDNMEIVSIPLSGKLEHKDSMDTLGVIGSQDVQAMSAGTGIKHSEYNHSKDEPVHFLQIWIFPKVRNIKPRYDQRSFDPSLRVNKVQRLVSPLEDGSETVKINQDAYISRAVLEGNTQLQYKVNREGNGVYLFVIDGEITFDEYALGRRDGAGISEVSELTMSSVKGADVLFIEVPMS